MKISNGVTSIWLNRSFTTIWIAGLFSSLAISFFMFSQSWYIVQTLNLEASLGLVFIATSVPRLIFMIIGGALADKFSKTKIMLISNLSRSILTFGLVLFLFSSTINIWTFVIFGLFFGILDAFFWSADGSILPEIINKDQLLIGNSITHMTNQVSLIIGPVIAGLFIKFSSYEVIFLLTAFFLIISAYFVSRLKLPTAREERTLYGDSMLQSIFSGIRYVRKSSFLSGVLTCSIFLYMFLIGPLQMGLPLFVKNILHGDTLHFSYLEGSLGGGMLLGAIIVGTVNLKRKRGLFTLIMILLSGVSFLLFSFTDELWESIIVIILFGATLALANIPLMAIIQSIVKEEMMGRVMSLVMLSSMGLIPLSYALTSVVLSLGIDIDVIMSTGAVFVLLFLVYVFFRFPVIRAMD